MPWKMDGDKIAIESGNPVWVHDDGKEVSIDGGHVTTKIFELTKENAKFKSQAREAQSALEAFDGLDVEAARKALSTVANLDAKKLIDAGEAEKVKSELAKGYEAKLAEAQKLIAEKDEVLTREMIGGRFSRSKFISDKLIVPADVAEAVFGRAFKIEDGKVVAYDHQGNRIYSREKPGEVADFDEALSLLVSAYPHRDSIMRDNGGSGSGAVGGGSGVGSKQMSADAFNKLNSKDRAAFMNGGGTLV